MLVWELESEVHKVLALVRRHVKSWGDNSTPCNQDLEADKRWGMNRGCEISKLPFTFLLL